MGILDALQPILSYLADFLRNVDVGRILPQRSPPHTSKAQFFLEWRNSGGAFPMHAPEPQLVAMLLSLLRSRHNWIEVPDALARVHQLCGHVLGHLGIDEACREALAQAGLVEVRSLGLAGGDQEAPWAFPWEFVLAEATRLRRQGMRAMSGQTFQVVRHLQAAGRRPVHAAADTSLRTPQRLLVVTSGPGWIHDSYEFEQEQRLIISSLAPQISADVLRDPDLPELRAFVQQHKPDIIHLAGVDARQGALMLQARAKVNQVRSEAREESGVFLRGAAKPEIVSFPELAQAVAASRPKLVTLNMYNSAIGAGHAVKGGAEAGIGFQDEIDDALAEHFCASLYSNWKRLSWDLAAAYQEAWRSIAHEPALRGSGIVLWSRNSLLMQALPTTSNPAPRSARSGEETPDGAPKRVRRLHRGRAVPAAPTIAADPTDPSARGDEAVISPDEAKDGDAHIRVTCQALRKLNFSLLHNDQDLYTDFTVRRQKPGAYRGIRVDVRLAAGSEEAAYVKIFNLDSVTPIVQLRNQVRLALTPRLGQVLAESMFGTISTEVRWGTHVLYGETQRIELLPVDEWRFDTVSGRWLPSFVFPRDPAVLRIIEAAQRYLIALRDDSSAGFDGYQSFDAAGTTMNERCHAVDAQVQAIWWALVNDFAPSYINPPPSFSAESQRLRTPSNVVDGRRGTCIDLTLLLASCLEYIDIYPVVFLLKDHAFPGYWRTEESHRHRLSSASLAPVDPDGMSPEKAISDAAPWMFGVTQFEDVLDLVREGHVVPIESTLLTSRGGFWDSISEGTQNLRSRSQFDSMFDIKLARTRVTPVPVWEYRR